MGKGKNRSEKRAFIRKVKDRLSRDPQSFLRLTDYNSIKKWMRRMHGCTGQFVDNGHNFLHIITSAMEGGDHRIRQKFLQLQAQHRRNKSGRRSSYGAMGSSHRGSSSSGQGSVAASTTASRGTCSAAVSLALSSLDQKPTAVAFATVKETRNDGERIDVFYGRTDNTPGDKEYTCVVVKTSETTLEYGDSLYFPKAGCRYEILNEVPMRQLTVLCEAEPTIPEPHSAGFVTLPLKQRVLKYCQENPSTKSGFNHSLLAMLRSGY